jgi:hypothetical protein
LDASGLAMGGGGALARAPGTLGKLGKVTQAAGRAIDPVTNAAKIVNPVARHVTGLYTGAGEESIKLAGNAGRLKRAGEQSRPTALTVNLRKQIPENVALEQGREAFQWMKDDKKTRYRQNMGDIQANQKQLMVAGAGNIEMRPIFDEFYKLEDSLKVGNYWKDKRAQFRMSIIKKELHDFYQQPDLHTVEGFDALKQRIQSMNRGTLRGNEARVVTEMSNAIKNAIQQQEPKYASAMADYEAASDLENQISKTLSMGGNATDDTATRKLLSSMRNNVNTNFSQRKKLIEELDKKAPGLQEALAGQTLSSWTPRGLAQITAQENLTKPWKWAALPLQSPRLMGELAYAAGKYGPRRAVHPIFQAGRAEANDRRNRGQY